VLATGGVLAAALTLAAAFGLACGGSTRQLPSVGSESHFLAYCSAGCAEGLDCIGGICTRSCLTEQAGCGDLSAAASCTNQSVEPGQVAVCDVGCQGDVACSGLGSGFACESGFCRQARNPSGGAAGAGGSNMTPDPTCHGVGRYQVGKEGGYLPCCAGLTELSTLLEATDADGNRSCEQFPLNSYSCIEGSCGDGICSEGEAPCGCGVDCPDSNWRSSAASCEPFRDQSPPPDVRIISITNVASVPLYILPDTAYCTAMLVGVARDGQALDLSAGLGCPARCGSVLDAGWPYAPTQASVPCPDYLCDSPAPVQIAPGQTREEPVRLERITQQLPRSCASGIAVPTVECSSLVIPQPGNYTLTVRAALLDCGPTADCDCNPDPSGACRNSVTLAQPFRFDFSSAAYFQNQVLMIGVPPT
jgi:hypothetical protein